MDDINDALRQFEITEANLKKLERLWSDLKGIIPRGVAYVESTAYDEKSLAFREILKSMPTIQGFEIADCLLDLSTIAQMRFQANELEEFDYTLSTEKAIYEQGHLLTEYRFRLEQARKSLVRNTALNLIRQIDNMVVKLQDKVNMRRSILPRTIKKTWDILSLSVNQLDVLLGSLPRPSRWEHLQRHLHFGEMVDLRDIIETDWPESRPGLERTLYGANDPIPVQPKDLTDLVDASPVGNVAVGLAWDNLTDEDFERLIFALITDTAGFENAKWLSKTHAADKGRDLSVDVVSKNELCGSRRERMIIQCRHLLSKSISSKDVADLKMLISLWEPPRIDRLVIATSGRFTSDAIALVEKHNESHSALRIEMWPESHLEALLAKRPAIVAEFGLRSPK